MGMGMGIDVKFADFGGDMGDVRRALEGACYYDDGDDKEEEEEEEEEEESRKVQVRVGNEDREGRDKTTSGGGSRSGGRKRKCRIKLLWLETPTNPTLKIASISIAASLAREYGSILCVDNTFASPHFQSPILHGADVVVHSVTKYIGGHSDVVMGAALTASGAPLCIW